MPHSACWLVNSTTTLKCRALEGVEGVRDGNRQQPGVGYQVLRAGEAWHPLPVSGGGVR